MPAMLQTFLAPYRRIFTRPTALFSVTGLVARLPISMVGLGIVLLAEHETGSYAYAGSVSAVALVANAVFAILQGRLIDRLGQGRVLTVATTLWGIGLSGTMWALGDGWPDPAVYALAARAGPNRLIRRIRPPRRVRPPRSERAAAQPAAESARSVSRFARAGRRRD